MSSAKSTFEQENPAIVTQKPAHVAALLVRFRDTLGMPPERLMEELGVARRTLTRWLSEGTRLPRQQTTRLAQLAVGLDRALAREIVALNGDTLASVGLEAAGPQAPPAALEAKLVDAVICAAAEVLDVSPRGMRPALLAAVRSAREAGFDLAALERVLALRARDAT